MRTDERKSPRRWFRRCDENLRHRSGFPLNCPVVGCMGCVGEERREKRRQRGMAILEFALTVPLFLVILLGALEYGYYFYVGVAATNAAREGARQCTLVSLGACGTCNPTNAVNYMGKLNLGTKTKATASCTNSSGQFLYTVNVTVDFPTLSGFSPVLATMPKSATSGNSVAYGVAVMRGQ
jgi:Flp pilus assembly protein TadG